jgi:aspartate-semialdehyde dehydrogenase
VTTRLGIVNPTTLVGAEITSILRERSFPYGKVTLLDSTGESAGALTDMGDEPAVVTPISADELEGLDIVFFCGSAAANGDWIARAGEAGFTAIDLSQPTSIEEGKLAIAGVNLDDLSISDKLIVSPHPIAIPLILVLRQIESASAIASCTATVVQPASESGQAGVEELAKQTISVLNIQSVPQTVFDRQLAFNLYPAPARQEEFIVGQVRSLVDPRIEMALLVTQGTIFHSHTFSLFVKTKEVLDEATIVETLRRSNAISFAEGDQQFGTIDAAGRDEVLISEVRPDPAIGGGFWVWAVCDNLRRSSALNAVLIAEKLLFGTGVTN